MAHNSTPEKFSVLPIDDEALQSLRDRSSKTEHFFKLTIDVKDQLRSANLTAAEWRIWIYLVSLDPKGYDVVIFSDAELMIACKVKKSTYFTAKAKFQRLGLFNFVDSTPRVNRERQILDLLKLKLGGQIEVVTAVGRIDLLTTTEVIEVKNINDWKGALGQILAYSAFFPEHSKRIHLFGRPDLAKLAQAQATCSEFCITVTFEEVQP